MTLNEGFSDWNLSGDRKYIFQHHNPGWLCYQVANYEMYDVFSEFKVCMTMLPRKPMGKNSPF